MKRIHLCGLAAALAVASSIVWYRSIPTESAPPLAVVESAKNPQTDFDQAARSQSEATTTDKPLSGSDVDAKPLVQSKVVAAEQSPVHSGFKELTYAANWTNEKKPEMAAFNLWARRYVQSESKAALVPEGLVLAKARLSAMIKLIESDPREAIASTVPASIREQLPPQVAPYLEARVSGRGNHLVFSAATESGARVANPVRREVTIEGTSYRPSVYGQGATDRSQSDLPMHGVAVGNLLALHESSVRVLEAGEIPDAAKEVFAADPAEGIITPSSSRAPANISEPTVVEVGRKLVHFASKARLVRFVSAMAGGGSASSHTASVLGGRTLSVRSPETEGAKKLLIIRVRFTDMPADPPTVNNAPPTPLTPQLLMQTMDQVNTWYKEFSYNKTSLVPSYTAETLLMPKTAIAYNNGDLDTMAQDALVLARAANYDVDSFYGFCLFFSDFRNVQATTPKPLFSTGNSWGGGIFINNQFKGCTWINGNTSLSLITHEVGHAYGLPHANLWTVTDNNPVSDGGKSKEYGDIYDTMGGGNNIGAHFNMAYKRRLDWITDANVTTVTASGTYTIARFDHPNALTFAPKLALKLKREDLIPANPNAVPPVPATERFYWIGYRRAPITDFTGSANPLINNGAYIIWETAVGGKPRNQNTLLDTQTPGSTALDAPLPLGKTLKDDAVNPPNRPNPIYITPVAQGGTAPAETLDVVINIGPFPANQPPIATIAPPPAVVSAGAPVTLTCNANDPNGDPLAFYWTVIDPANPNAPQAPNQNINTLTKTFALGGTYTVNCLVSDMKGGEVTATTNVMVVDPLQNFAPRVSTVTDGITDIASSGTSLVAIADKKILTSADGATWKSQDVALDRQSRNNITLQSVTFGNGTFVGVGSDYDFGTNGWVAYIATSPNGTTWTSINTPKVGGLSGVVFGNNTFVAVGGGGTILTSPTGATWTQRTSGVTKDLLGVTFGTSGFVAVGGKGAMLRSADGVAWADVAPAGTTVDFKKVAFGAGTYVAIGWGRDAYTSTNGQQWTARSVQNSFFYDLRGITFANNQFLAVGRRAEFGGGAPTYARVTLSSADGITWTERALNSPQDLAAVTFFANSYFVAGAGGTILQSGTLAVTGGPVGPVAPVVNSPTNVTGTVGEPFNYQITATNSPTGFTAAPRPAGLMLNATTGAITGIPMAAGATQATVTATNAAGASPGLIVNFTINAPKPAITSAATAIGMAGQAFNYQIAATNNPTAYGATGLPNGLMVNTNNGAITGTPNDPGMPTAKISATNASGTTTLDLMLNIAAVNAVPAITSALNDNAVVGQAYNYQITGTNTPTAFNATGLPNGLMVDANGAITGTPNADGVVQVVLTASNATGNGTATLNLTVAAAPIDQGIGGEQPLAPSPAARVLGPVVTMFPHWNTGGAAIPYAQDTETLFGAFAVQTGNIGNSQNSFVETNITGPGTISFWWKVSSEKNSDFFKVLLDNVEQASISGEVDWDGGTVAIPAGTHTLRFSFVKDAAGSAGADAGWLDDVEFTAASVTPEITSASEVAAAVGQTFSYQITATNNPTSFTAEGLPPGVSLNASTGTIVGVPTDDGAYLPTLTATNSEGDSLPFDLIIKVAGPAPIITSALVASSMVNEGVFRYQITAAGNPDSYDADPLPSGLSINKGTGLISGRPSLEGAYNITISATSINGTSVPKVLVLTVASEPPFVTSSSKAQAYPNKSFNFRVLAHGGNASFSATGLPTGLSIDPGTGVISGTPTQTGVFDVIVTIIADDGDTSTFHLTLTSGAPNDNFAGRRSLAGSTFGDDGFNPDATAEAGEPAHAGSTAAHSLWWSWTAPRSGMVKVYTDGSDFDTVLAVYDGSTLASLAPVGANDNVSAGDQTSLVKFTAVAGHTYQIAVDGAGGASGNIVLTGRYAGMTTYNGLLQDVEAPENNGFVTVSVTDTWGFSAKVRYGSMPYPLQGAFDPIDGTFSGTILRGALPALAVDLAIDVIGGTDALFGTISDGNTSTDLWADLPQSNLKGIPSPQAGKYTVVIDSSLGFTDQTPAEVPQGHSHGTVVVDATGKLRFAGMLGDGSKKVSQGTNVSRDGEWPFYVANYSPVGSMSGWAFFKNADEPSDIGGNMTWVKPVAKSAKELYPGGFLVEELPLTGSRYTPPAKGAKVLSFSSCTLTTGDGGLGGGIVTRAALLSSDNKVAIDGGKMTIALPTGLFSGSFIDGTGKTRTFQGALLQSENAGFGFFLGTGQTGIVDFAPTSP